jgi:hypothetical protein
MDGGTLILWIDREATLLELDSIINPCSVAAGAAAGIVTMVA